MTLVELLLATTITGMLGAVIAAAFMVGVKTTDSANTRLKESRGAPVLAKLFPADVNSAKTIVASATPCQAGTPDVATLSWTDGGVAKTAVYTCQPSGTSTDLARRYTVGAVTTVSVVAYDVTSAVLTCTPDCTTPTGATMTAMSGDFQYVVSANRRAS